MFLKCIAKNISLPGSFTVGRIYVGFPMLQTAGVVSDEKVRVLDSAGTVVTLRPDDDRFQKHAGVAVVFVQKVGDHEPGDIVLVSVVSDDGFFAVEGNGYISQSGVLIVDDTIMFTGAWSRLKDGYWHPVEEVLEPEMKSKVNGTWHRWDELILPVSDGDVMAIPMMVCVDAGDFALTEGKAYVVSRTIVDVSSGRLVVVRDDVGEEKEYMITRFMV